MVFKKFFDVSKKRGTTLCKKKTPCTFDPVVHTGPSCLLLLLLLLLSISLFVSCKMIVQRFLVPFIINYLLLLLLLLVLLLMVSVEKFPIFFVSSTFSLGFIVFFFLFFSRIVQTIDTWKTTFLSTEEDSIKSTLYKKNINTFDKLWAAQFRVISITEMD